MTLQQYIIWKEELYKCLMISLVLKAKEEEKTSTEWASFITSKVTRIKNNKMTKYYLNYATHKPIILLLQMKEHLGEYEEYISQEINTI